MYDNKPVFLAALYEIEAAIARIAGLTKKQAYDLLGGFNDDNDDEEFECNGIFDFEADHVVATMVFENNKFLRIGYGIYVYGIDGDPDETYFVDDVDELIEFSVLGIEDLTGRPAYNGQRCPNSRWVEYPPKYSNKETEEE